MKIVIIEDEARDIENFYRFLSNEKEVYIYYAISQKKAEELEADGMLEMDFMIFSGRIKELGFKENNIFSDLKYLRSDADFYFIDGLEGSFDAVGSSLQKNKVYIISTDLNLRKLAEQKGYKTADKKIENIEKILGK